MHSHRFVVRREPPESCESAFSSSHSHRSPGRPSSFSMTKNPLSCALAIYLLPFFPFSVPRGLSLTTILLPFLA